jgi:hypothetical protein
MTEDRSSKLGPFDRFAEASSDFAGHATFFLACVIVVIVWLPSFFIFRDANTWQLVINTATTIVTFLLVALLQNSARRFEESVQKKLDALADGLADLMICVGSEPERDLSANVEDLRKAVGLGEVDSTPSGSESSD